MILLYPPVDGLKAILDRQTAPGHGVSWRFGRRVHPVTGETQSEHDGNDLGAADGDPIRVVADGSIAAIDEAPHGGKYFRVLHDGDVYPIAMSGYCHMSAFAPGLSVGDLVKRGTVIGYVGSTGQSTGAHLHFQLWVKNVDGKMTAIDPLPLLQVCVCETPIPFGGNEEIV
jgi:murein DD-endopeptidase MepM/ murein hydrolase activator NlpD